jgi:hypothetical protein
LQLFGNVLALLAIGWFHAARPPGEARRMAGRAGAVVLLAATGISIAGIVKVYVDTFPGGSEGLVWMQFGLVYAFVGLALLHFARPLTPERGSVIAVAATVIAVAFACVGLGFGLAGSVNSYFLKAEAWLYLAPVWAVIATAAYLGIEREPATGVAATAAGP